MRFVALVLLGAVLSVPAMAQVRGGECDWLGKRRVANQIDLPIDYESLERQIGKARLLRRLASAYGAGGCVPSGHSFQFEFRTTDPVSNVPESLRARYPDTMSIVLQYKFESLQVSSTRMEFTVFFDGAPRRLLVPFDQIVSFGDLERNYYVKLE